MQHILKILTVIVSFIYPAYATFRCLNMKVRSKYCIWQIYWIMYAIYASVVAITDHYIWWLPLYEETKFVFILWLLPTVGSGCIHLYNRFILSYLNHNKRAIDAEMHGVRSAVYNYTKFVVYLLYKIVLYAAQRLGLVHSNNDLHLTDSLQRVIVQFLEKRRPKNHGRKVKNTLVTQLDEYDDAPSDDDDDDDNENEADNNNENQVEIDDCDGEEEDDEDEDVMDVDVNDHTVRALEKKMLEAMKFDNMQCSSPKVEGLQMDKFNVIMLERNGRTMSDSENNDDFDDY